MAALPPRPPRPPRRKPRLICAYCGSAFGLPEEGEAATHCESCGAPRREALEGAR